MNTVMQQIKERQSTRAFIQKSIPENIKAEILQAAFEAPTAGCMMFYTIIDITDQALKDKLAISCDDQPFIAEAPLVLIFLADNQRWYDTFKYEDCDPRQPGEGDLLLSCADAVIAAQNTVVAAESFGIGSCYIGDILENCEDIREMLNLPDYVFPAAMVVYGYPDETKKRTQKVARFEKEYIVFENQYKTLTKEQHETMHETLLNKRGVTAIGRNQYIKKLSDRKYMSDFSLEMTRSAAEYISKFRTK